MLASDKCPFVNGQKIFVDGEETNVIKVLAYCLSSIHNNGLTADKRAIIRCKH
jgi:hypothetical protein